MNPQNNNAFDRAQESKMPPQDNGQENSPDENNAASLLEELKAQGEKLKNDYLYLRAEFDTYRRNAIKERSDAAKYGAERLLNDILGVLDNFERALATKMTADNVADFRKGIEMTASELKSVLNKHGVSEVPIEHGKPFDPTVHEALSSEPHETMAPGSVTRVLRKPYKLHDRVLRPGQVVVATEGKKSESKGE